MSKIPFTKMHGCGNDYIYVNVAQHPIESPKEAAIKWSDRHKGIGSDGLVLIDKSPVPEADFSMRIFNADGSEAMMCGNASRCIGKYLYEKTHPWPLPIKEGNGYQETEIRLLTLSGIKTLYLHIVNDIVESVTVDMGEPAYDVPTQFIASRGLDKGTFVSMGNPHYVIFTENVEQVGEVGRTLEYHPAFPQRCNIEFAKVIGGDDEEDDKKTIMYSDLLTKYEGLRTKAFSQCQTCAAALGLTITSRCRLVMPKAQDEPKVNKFSRFMGA